jgi:hypothetical protein
MTPIGRRVAHQQPESIEFVPKRDLDRAQRELIGYGKKISAATGN